MESAHGLRLRPAGTQVTCAGDCLLHTSDSPSKVVCWWREAHVVGPGLDSSVSVLGPQNFP